MGFGTNPHVAKAEAAQAKADEATDVAAEVMALREAAHLWERAASKEKEGKRRSDYEARAEAARERADAASAKPATPVSEVAARIKRPPVA
jgi:hypothetical protein